MSDHDVDYYDDLIAGLEEEIAECEMRIDDAQAMIASCQDQIHEAVAARALCATEPA